MPLQVKEVCVRRMKGGLYLLKLAWSDGTCSEVNQCFQDLKMTYDEVSSYFLCRLLKTATYIRTSIYIILYLYLLPHDMFALHVHGTVVCCLIHVELSSF